MNRHLNTPELQIAKIKRLHKSGSICTAHDQGLFSPSSTCERFLSPQCLMCFCDGVRWKQVTGRAEVALWLMELHSWPWRRSANQEARPPLKPGRDDPASILSVLLSSRLPRLTPPVSISRSLPSYFFCIFMLSRHLQVWWPSRCCNCMIRWVCHRQVRDICFWRVFRGKVTSVKLMSEKSPKWKWVSMFYLIHFMDERIWQHWHGVINLLVLSW